MMRKYFDMATNIFKALCGTTSFFMVGFWALKFYRNEDVSVIEYMSYASHGNIAYPELSICFMRPYIIQNLISHPDGNVSADEYDGYLHGDTKLLEKYAKISFNNVNCFFLEFVRLRNIPL